MEREGKGKGKGGESEGRGNERRGGASPPPKYCGLEPPPGYWYNLPVACGAGLRR